MPTARYDPAVGVIGGKLYVAGGCCESFDFPYPRFSALEVYDPATDSWITKAPMPIGVMQPSYGVIGDKLYVAGGFASALLGGEQAVLQVYDPAGDTWTTKAPMPYTASATAFGVIDGKLYVVGSSGSTPFSTLRVYDPVADAWSIKAPMPDAGAHMAAGVIDGKLYVTGGVVASPSCPGPGCAILSTLRVYDPVTNTWDASRAPMPTPRFGHKIGVLNGRLHAIGGDGCGNCGTVLATHEVYDPSTNAWTTETPMPTARFALGAAAIDDRLYAVGGWRSPSEVMTSVLEVFTPAPAPYAFAGFFAPVANLPVINNVKAGSAIPVKFSLGGDQGLAIFAPGSPQSEVISCASGVPTGAITETVSAGGSSLSYDPSTGTYTYVWKTDRAWANTCRDLAVTFVDGTTHRASFMFSR